MVSYLGALGMIVGIGATDGVLVGTEREEVESLKASIPSACIESSILIEN